LKSKDKGKNKEIPEWAKLVKAGIKKTVQEKEVS
jgi:hypothetical protein